MSQPYDLGTDGPSLGNVDPSSGLPGDAPRHGFRGDLGSERRRQAPLGLAIAVSREAGARGGTIARLVGRRLGWQVYDQDLLEYMAHDPVVLDTQGVAPSAGGVGHEG